MQIVLAFNEQVLDSAARRGSPLVFTISWEHRGIYYPMRNWEDFGVVIVDWWFAAVMRLALGSEREKFEFMDGPYSVSAVFHRNTGMVELTPDVSQTSWLHSSEWVIPFTDLTAELIHATSTIQEKLSAGKYGLREVTLLKKDVEALEGVLCHVKL